jgi:hypothetical protein
MLIIVVWRHNLSLSTQIQSVTDGIVARRLPLHAFPENYPVTTGVIDVNP